VNLKPEVRYAGSFVVFMALLVLFRTLPLPDLLSQILFVTVMAVVVYFLAWPVLDFKVRQLGSTVAIGVLVFLIWIGPDLLSSSYRHHWIFENPLMGQARSGLSELAREQPAVLFFRTVRAVLIVPVVEELFWRAWLARWLISPRFEEVPLGTWSAQSFWIVAVLFASEHGSYWDVGLAAGIIYNWWMLRTKSLGDLILAHAVTNGCLCAYVIAFGKWEYWA
jgi:CAAX prenyl protease-like protein